MNDVEKGGQWSLSTVFLLKFDGGMENNGERRVESSATSCSESTPAQPIQIEAKRGNKVGRDILLDKAIGGSDVGGEDRGDEFGEECEEDGRLSQVESATPIEFRCRCWWLDVDLGDWAGEIADTEAARSNKSESAGSSLARSIDSRAFSTADLIEL